MAKQTKVHRAGAYVVKAAESRPAKVGGKATRQRSVPTAHDRTLATALLKAKRP